MSRTDLLLGLLGSDAALTTVVRRRNAGVGGEPENIVTAVTEAFEQAPPRVLSNVTAAGDRGDLREFNEDRLGEQVAMFIGVGAGDGQLAALLGLVRAPDQALKCPGGLVGPVVGRPGLRSIGEITDQVCGAQLVAGELAEAGVVIEGVAVMHRDPGERVEDTEGVEGAEVTACY